MAGRELMDVTHLQKSYTAKQGIYILKNARHSHFYGNPWFPTAPWRQLHSLLPLDQYYCKHFWLQFTIINKWEMSARSFCIRGWQSQSQGWSVRISEIRTMGTNTRTSTTISTGTWAVPILKNLHSSVPVPVRFQKTFALVSISVSATSCPIGTRQCQC
jgi:hypothetical protein